MAVHQSPGSSRESTSQFNQSSAFPKKEKCPLWLTKLLDSSLGNAEKTRPKLGATTTPTFGYMSSLRRMFVRFAGKNENDERVDTFQLTVNRQCYTLLFVNCVRYDLDLGSIVMDAYVVPLTDSSAQELKTAHTKLQETNMISLDVSQAEFTLWKNLMPVLAERCRTWEHTSSCEYQEKGVPVSICNNESPFCSCGEGKVERKFRKARKTALFAKYATRVAIMPIFPVPYLDPNLVTIAKSKASVTKSEESSPSETKQEKEQKQQALAGPSEPSQSEATEKQEQTQQPPAIPRAQNPHTPKCDHCNKPSETPLKLCSRCGKVHYYGVACQKAAWKEHKKDCVQK